MKQEYARIWTAQNCVVKDKFNNLQGYCEPIRIKCKKKPTIKANYNINLQRGAEIFHFSEKQLNINSSVDILLDVEMVKLVASRTDLVQQPAP